MRGFRRRGFLGRGAAAAFSAAVTPIAWSRSTQAAAAPWTARWITVPGAAPRGFGVYHFRRAFELKNRPQSFVVHVSGDNRYQLFCNGKQVAWGPARGDLANWRFETVDLAPHLKPGKNVLAAVVWNFGDLSPMAQVSHRTAFVLQGQGEAERIVDTGASWSCTTNRSYEPIRFTHGQMMGYFVAGPGERIRGATFPWDWEKPSFDNRGWQAPELLDVAGLKVASDSHSRWALVPRDIPMMEERPLRLAKTRRSEGMTPPALFPQEPAPFEIPARTKIKLLLDQSVLTTGFPELLVAGGKGATVRLTYAESLRGAAKREKGNRNDVEGKEIRGYHDEFHLEGGADRLYRPLWWRTWRYIELSVETGDAPLTVLDLRATFAAYPFQQTQRFDSDAPELAKMLEIGWRTARLCAHETYMDCPYYEQLQYAGDTRIQCLVSLFASGDDRLMRKAIIDLDDSRVGADPTASRYPSELPQYIPGFSLWWIGMVYDHFWYRNDPQLIKRVLPGVRAVLAWYARFQLPSGLLGPLPWWNYVDWTKDWPGGTPPGWPRAGRPGKPGEETFALEDPLGSSSLFDLQHLLALEWAATLEKAHGLPALGASFQKAAQKLRPLIRKTYWDAKRGLMADTGHQRHFSQQANALAVLANVITGKTAASVMEQVLVGSQMTAASIYFRYYVHSAAVHAGLGDRYLDMLGIWRKQMSLGLSTWAEDEEPARSDCHAWGASPNIELLRTVLGVDAAAPGFAKVLIKPHLGALKRAAGTVPHPKGAIEISLKVDGKRLHAEIQLPPGLEGELQHGRLRSPLKPGANRVSLGNS